MKRFLHLTAGFLLVLFSFATALQLPADRAYAALADGKYQTQFKILKDGTDEASMMDTYTEKPATIEVENGKIYASFTLKQSAEITNFKVEQNGVLTETKTVSEDKDANTRVVKFEVGDLSAKINGWVKIYWDLGGFIYDESYNVQIEFDNNLKPVNVQNPDDKTTTPDDKTTDPGDKTTTPDDKTTDPGDKTTTPDDKTTDPGDKTTTPDDKTTKPGDSTNSNKLEDGTYSIQYSVLKGDTDETSRMSDYFSHPATLTVKDGKQLISFTIKDSTSVRSLQTEDNGALKEVKTVRTNEAKNTRDVAFNVSDLSKTVDGKVKISVPAANYEGTYDIRFKFDQKSIAAMKDGGSGNHSTVPSAKKTDQTSVPPTSNSKTKGAELEDGIYRLPFTVYYPDKNEKSRMNDYFASPATLVVKNGKKYASFTVKDSSSITKLEIGVGGKYVDTHVAAVDKKANTRIVQYEIENLNEDQHALVKIDLPEFNYHEQYEVRFVYDVKNIEKGQGSGVASVIGQKGSLTFDKKPSTSVPTTVADLISPVSEKNGAEHLKFDRDADSSDHSADKTDTANPKTGDAGPLFLYSLLLSASLFVLIKKYRTRTL
ncbi:NEAT domain-containing protein [Bacillus sonorensis]|uniref:NEAT domain-containing protein n=1 Tax=Bacillus sonorensis TaxID=119858 RepID=UPI0004965D8F|nr:NEAT domain-containing protein [Bacillus sonorensis]MBG9916095.1 cell surface protein [Bacillus sonorensis]MDR4959092.1 NEAT domain-containing protein [Bacillus sonorensis]MEC1588488.1 NEAT domain-containing protein [Bacillus sonorensis]